MKKNNADKTKFYTICRIRYGKELSMSTIPGIYLTRNDAAEKVAELANKVPNRVRKGKVKASECDKRYTVVTSRGRQDFIITSHSRPWAVLHVDDCYRLVEAEMFPDKSTAEAAVVKKAKAAIKEMNSKPSNKVSSIYANRVRTIYGNAKDMVKVNTSMLKTRESAISVCTRLDDSQTWVASQL